MQMEILAPAGSREALVAGVRCGANAVYLGGKSLSARRNAGNFDDAELERAAEYCLARNVKIYLTLNTLCRDDELEEAYRLAPMRSPAESAALLCRISALQICCAAVFPLPVCTPPHKQA